MAVIVEERGRGKFKPAPNYHPDEVKELLYKKIEEEKNKFATCSEPIDFSKLCYDEGKYNLLSLFSGCGGLDLGFELAGLKAVMGEDVAEAAIHDKAIFDANIANNVFNTIYVNDIFDEARETYETEDWLIIVTSDHGGIGTGHGGASIQERMTFLVMNKDI